MGWVLEKPTSSRIIKKLTSFYGTKLFITAFTRARHLSLSWVSSIQSIPPHPNSWRSMLILSSNLRLGLLSGSFPQIYPPKPCMRLSCPHYKLNHHSPLLLHGKRQKARAAPVHALKAYKGSGSTAPLVFNLGTNLKRVSNLTPLLLYPCERTTVSIK